MGTPPTTFGERARKRREDLALTQTAVARRAGIKQPTLSGIESGEYQGTKYVHELARALRTTAAWLREGKGAESTDEVREPGARYEGLEPGPETQGLCPVISWVTAGSWEPTSDPFHPGDAEEWIGCPVKHGPMTYVLRVRGSSMDDGTADGYPDGILIYIDPQEEVRPGCDVIARLVDKDETTFKRYKLEDGHGYLRPLNPRWPEQYIPVTDKTVFKGVCIFSGKKRR